MRLAPVVLFFHLDRDKALDYAAKSSLTTFAAPEALVCWLSHCFGRGPSPGRRTYLDGSAVCVTEPFGASLAANILARPANSAQRYCGASLEAASWCVSQTTNFEDAILAAANLGEDADTTAAITGQLAGASLWGGGNFRALARAILHLDDIEEYARKLFALRAESRPAGL